VASGVSFDLKRIVFADLLTGYITGFSTSQMLKTEDGGNSWSVISYPQGLPDLVISDLVFLNDSAGIIVCDALEDLYIYRTDDKGVSWSETYSGWPSSSEGELVFLDDLTGFYTVPTPIEFTTFLVITHDGGFSWTSYMPVLWWKDARSMCTFDTSTVFAVGSVGTIHKSSNSGVDWTRLDHKIFDGDVYGVQFVDQDNGYAFNDITGNGVPETFFMKTTDGGVSWERAGDLSFYLGASCFLNKDTGFVAANLAGISLNKTTDGGAHWTSLETGYDDSGEHMMIKFFDVENGFIGWYDHLIRTTDGGDTWTEVETGINYGFDFKDLEYVTLDTIFVGWNYQTKSILRSTDGGETWETIVIEGLISANDLFFLNNQTAFLACYNQIFKSTDGGSTWSPVVMNNANPINILSLSFPTPGVGYASGSGSYENMLKTTDGGNTWNPLETNVSSALNNVYFFDNDNGVAFGNNGLMIRTTTGGVVSTEKHQSINTGNLLKVYPNPASSFIAIESQMNASWRLELSDMKGQILSTINFAGNSKILDISTLSPGLYFVRLSNDKTVEVGKFIKNRL